MKTAFKTSSVRDLKKVKNQQILGLVSHSIEAAEKCKSINDIPNIKQLKGVKKHFRIRIGAYRIGLALEEEKLYFVRCLPRKDIYKLFP
jgi:mRNA interferase RelE/StbE